MDNFGQKLKNARIAKGISQKELSKQLHVGISTISMWENNKNSMDIKLAKQISEILDISLDYLVGNNKANDIPLGIKKELEKMQLINSENLPDKLESIAKELLELSKKLKNL